MRFEGTPIPGLYAVQIEPSADERGFFARTWCRDEFAAHGLDARLVQCGVSFNRRRGTVRGMHFQAAPHAEAKLVRVTAGAIYDVGVDLRPDSPTYGQWAGFELSAANRTALYLPAGVAHGFQTLADDTEVLYQMTEGHAPDAARGYRFDDAAWAIAWPLPVSCISDRDLAWPRFEPLAMGLRPC